MCDISVTLSSFLCWLKGLGWPKRYLLSWCVQRPLQGHPGLCLLPQSLGEGLTFSTLAFTLTPWDGVQSQATLHSKAASQGTGCGGGKGDSHLKALPKVSLEVQ